MRLDDLLGSFDLDMTDASLQHAIKDLVSFFSLPVPVKASWMLSGWWGPCWCAVWFFCF